MPEKRKISMGNDLNKRRLLGTCLCVLMLLLSGCTQAADSDDIPAMLPEEPHSEVLDEGLDIEAESPQTQTLTLSVQEIQQIPLHCPVGTPIFQLAQKEQKAFFWPAGQPYLLWVDENQNSGRMELPDAGSLCVYQPQTDRWLCSTESSGVEGGYGLCCYEMDGTLAWSSQMQEAPYIIAPYADGCLYSSSQTLYWVDADGAEELLFPLPAGDLYIIGRDESNFYFSLCVEDGTDASSRAWFRVITDTDGEIVAVEDTVPMNGNCALWQTESDVTVLMPLPDGTLSAVKLERFTGAYEILAEIPVPQGKTLQPEAACAVADEYYVFAACLDADGDVEGRVLLILDQQFQCRELLNLPIGVEEEILLARMQDEQQFIVYTAGSADISDTFSSEVYALRQAAINVYQVTMGLAETVSEEFSDEATNTQSESPQINAPMPSVQEVQEVQEVQQVQQVQQIPLDCRAGTPIFDLVSTEHDTCFWPAGRAYLLWVDENLNSERMELPDEGGLCVYQPQTDRWLCTTYPSIAENTCELSCYEMDGAEVWSRQIQTPYVIMPYADGCLYSSSQALYWVDADGAEELLFPLPVENLYIIGRDEDHVYFFLKDIMDITSKTWYRVITDTAGNILAVEDVLPTGSSCTLSRTEDSFTALTVLEDGGLAVIVQEEITGACEVLKEIPAPQGKMLQPEASCVVADEYYVFAACLDADGDVEGKVLLILDQRFQCCGLLDLPIDVEEEVLLARTQDERQIIVYTAGSADISDTFSSEVYALRQAAINIYRVTLKDG